ncbi:MAG: sulfite exporter TauE/SafE family protein [Gammaproteobacteria bacterium]
MEPVALTFSSALLMGLVFGAGPCNVTCLPYLGPVFLGSHPGAWRTIAAFSLGRLAAYAGLGAVAGAAGRAATSWLDPAAASIALGGATLVVGVLLWRRAGASRRCAAQPRGGEVTATIYPRRPAAMPLGLFAMGASMGLNPCVPLATVLVAAAASAAWQSGLWLGLGFGVGAVLMPALVFGAVMAHFGLQVRAALQRWGGVVERAAGVGLMVLGGATAMGWIRP